MSRVSMRVLGPARSQKTEKAAESTLGDLSLGVDVTRLDSQGVERRLVDRGGGVKAVISLIPDESFTR